MSEFTGIKKQIEDEITKKLVSDALNREYASIFLVDVKEDRYQFVYRNPESGFADVPGGIYTETINEYIQRVDPSYQKEWQNLATIDNLIKFLEKEDRKEYVYPLRGIKKPWRRSTSHVIERENGTVTKFIMTYMTIDSAAAENFRLMSEIKKQKEALEVKQKQLEEALEKAEDANSAKSRFLFNMSHDIRTPLNAMTGYTALIRKHINDPDKINDYLNKMSDSSDNLLQLINQVLDMSRIESGEVILENKPFDLYELCERLYVISNSSAQIKDINLDFDNISITHNNIIGDSARLSQLLINILGNSVKYTKGNGNVTFSITEKETDNSKTSFEFVISDNGIGMSKEFIDKIFEPFSREKTVTENKIEGVGLGMSIVKKLVDIMDGSIYIESEEGKGTKTTITIPFEISLENISDKKEKYQINHELFVNKKVLLVEDNEMNREIAKELLEDYGIIVDEADDGKKAVEAIRELIASGNSSYYDYILMDIQMPVMNGYDATKNIREMEGDKIHIPIIAVTANAFEEDRRNAISSGMDEHVSKPINIYKLLEAISKMN